MQAFNTWLRTERDSRDSLKLKIQALKEKHSQLLQKSAAELDSITQRTSHKRTW